MQCQISDLINEQRIAVGLNAKSDKEAIQKVCNILVRTEDIEEEYWEDVYQREREFPTGLPTMPVSIAIPHADPDHVTRTSIAIGILEEPVEFRQMGADPTKTVQAWIVFLLAIKEVEKQVDLIRSLMVLVQNQNLLRKIIASKTPAGVLEVINQSP
ncbi:MAG TPA: PTS sugar transporter subunit IIA [Anaerolineae bacterium]|nr:PTS sugar transporter subunit IIA [Anaerolineae bacterium]